MGRNEHYHWTEARKEQLKELYQTLSANEIAKVMELSRSVVKNAIHRFEIKKDHFFDWTPKRITILKNLYPNKLTDEIATELGCSKWQVYNMAWKLGLKKSKEFVAEQSRLKMLDPNHPGRKHQFKKGHVPQNKGVKGVHYPGCEKTWFQKGHLDGRAKDNRKPVGTISVVHNYKRGTKSLRIKVSEHKWRQLAHVIWEEHNGPIPEGMFPVHIDRDPMNCVIENLMLVTREEHGRRWVMTDGSIAKQLSGMKGTGKGRFDKELIQEIKKHPDLIEAKRLQLTLKHRIYKHAEGVTSSASAKGINQ